MLRISDLNPRPLGLLELCQLDAGTQIDLVQNNLEFRLGEAFPALGDGHGQAVERGARNPPRQKPVPELVEERQKLFAMINASGPAIGGIFNPNRRRMPTLPIAPPPKPSVSLSCARATASAS